MDTINQTGLLEGRGHRNLLLQIFSGPGVQNVYDSMDAKFDVPGSPLLLSGIGKLYFVPLNEWNII